MRRLLGAAAIAGALFAGVTVGAPAASAAPAASPGGWVPYTTCYYGNPPPDPIYNCDVLFTWAAQVSVPATTQFVQTIYPPEGTGGYHLYLFYVWES